jgi:hypothetical protein
MLNIDPGPMNLRSSARLAKLQLHHPKVILREPLRRQDSPCLFNNNIRALKCFSLSKILLNILYSSLKQLGLILIPLPQRPMLVTTMSTPILHNMHIPQPHHMFCDQPYTLVVVLPPKTSIQCNHEIHNPAQESRRVNSSNRRQPVKKTMLAANTISKPSLIRVL